MSSGRSPGSTPSIPATEPDQPNQPAGQSGQTGQTGPSGPGERRDLVVVSLEPWDEVWRRNQHLVAGLLGDDPALRVLFVEPPVDHLHDLRRGASPSLHRRLRPLGPRDGAPEGRAWAYRPTKWLPRRIAPGADGRRARQVARVARRLGMRSPVLWVNDPAGATLLRVTGWPALYDVTDDWLRAVREPAEIARLQSDEDALMARCAEVVVCSPALARTKGALRPVTLLTNAVDVDGYRAPAPRPADLPDQDYVLYVGTLHRDRLDIEATLRLAVRLTRSAGARLVLVGPVALDPTDTTRLEAAGVVVLGPRPASTVPAYLQHAKVLVVPHVVDDFTDSLDPIKLYEYLAVGRPIVSTPVAGFRDQAPGLVTMASPSAFPEAVLEVLAAARADDATRTSDPAGSGSSDPDRDALVRLPRWSDRVREMEAVLTRVRAATSAPTPG